MAGSLDGIIKLVAGIDRITARPIEANLTALPAVEFESSDNKPGMAVETDKSKFCKRKCHKAHRIEGVWVISQRKPTLVEDRKTETLESIDLGSAMLRASRDCSLLSQLDYTLHVITPTNPRAMEQGPYEYN